MPRRKKKSSNLPPPNGKEFTTGKVERDIRHMNRMMRDFNLTPQQIIVEMNRQIEREAIDNELQSTTILRTMLINDGGSAEDANQGAEEAGTDELNAFLNSGKCHTCWWKTRIISFLAHLIICELSCTI